MTEQKTASCTVSLVDICDPQYLTDHHSREGEQFLGIDVNRDSTIGDLRAGIVDEWNSREPEDGEPDEADLLAAVDEAFPIQTSLDRLSTEVAGDSTAWVLVRWTTE